MGQWLRRRSGDHEKMGLGDYERNDECGLEQEVTEGTETRDTDALCYLVVTLEIT